MEWKAEVDEVVVEEEEDEAEHGVGSEEGNGGGWGAMGYAVLRRGWSLGKKAAIAGAAIASAPVVIPPLVVLSTLGFVTALPFGVYFVSFACTDKVMRSLLPIPLSEEDQHEEEADGYEEDVRKEEPGRREEREEETGGVSEESAGAAVATVEKSMDEGESVLAREEKTAEDKAREEEREEEEEQEEEPLASEKEETRPLTVGPRVEEVGNREVAGSVEKERPIEETSKGEEREDKEAVEKEGESAAAFDGEEVAPRISSMVAVAPLVHEPTEKEDGGRAEEKQMHEMGMTGEGELERKGKVEEVAAPESEERSAEAVMMVEREKLNEEKMIAEERDKVEERMEDDGEVSISPKTEEPSNDNENSVAVAFADCNFETKPSSLTVDYSSVVLENGNGRYIKIVEEEGLIEETTIREGKEEEREVENEVKRVHSAREGEPLKSTLAVMLHVERDIEIEPSSLSSEYASAMEDQSPDATDNESRCSVEHVSDMKTGPKAVVAEEKSIVPSNDEEADTAQGSFFKEQPNITYSEEELWDQIQAMRTIVGYKAALCPSYAEEIRALYLFIGVEPPLSSKESSDLMEADNKLRFLKSVIGVK